MCIANIDINAGRRGLARRYLEQRLVLIAAQKALDDATAARDKARNDLATLDSELCKSVGSNIDRRAWVIDGDIVVAEHNRADGHAFACVRVIAEER